MRILFKSQAFKKLRAYILGIEYEISGFGKVEKVDGNLIVTDVKIFPQVVSQAHTTLDAQGLAQFFDDLIVAGEDIGQWKLWWHSHVYMTAQFSNTDYETIEEFDTELPDENWMLSIVANKMGDIFAQVNIFQPIKCSINNVPWDIEVDDQALTADIKQEIIDNVTILPPRTQKKALSNPVLSLVSTQKKSLISQEDRKKLFRDFPHLAKKLLPEAIDTDVIYDADGKATYTV